MARYLQTVSELEKEVDVFLHAWHEGWRPEEIGQVTQRLGHIINLAVRCSPRQPQGTVRKNIVEGAIRKWCTVTMTKEVDEITGRGYNKIHINAKNT